MPDATIHNWIYVIIPIRNYKLNTGRTREDEHPVFAAFCKQCRQYFTEQIELGVGGKAHITNSNLPRYGCEPISDDVTAIP